VRLFSHDHRPVQIIFAGKAHPADEEGKRIIQRLTEWCRHPAVSRRVAFIEDYDLQTGRMLVQGVDVWINNPRRPLEASGTSGQKVCFNGGLNCSVMDGWWPEGYNGRNGWVVGREIPTADQQAQDLVDAESLYATLEQEIIPLYYRQDAAGIPREWVRWMKESICSNAPVFNTDRMVRDYAVKIYAASSQTTSAAPILATIG
jgi:starch phosphorylase